MRSSTAASKCKQLKDRSLKKLHYESPAAKALAMRGRSIAAQLAG